MAKALKRLKLFLPLPFVALFFLFLFLFNSCHEKRKYLSISGQTMGTTYSIRFSVTKDLFKDISESTWLQNKKAEISKLLEEINLSFSTYEANSEITRFNKHNSLEPIELSPSFLYVLDHSLLIAKLTLGSFDPSVYSLVQAWGFGPKSSSQSLSQLQSKKPSKDHIEKLLSSSVGYNYINLVKAKNLVKKEKKQIMIDLSASAKGYGVDRLAQYLDEMNIENYLVEIGGELRLKGKGPKANKQNWRIGIEEPNYKLKKFIKKILHVSNISIATSGTYRNYFENNNEIYSHIISPLTGMAKEGNLLSVTVLDEKSCMNADAWATALMTMELDTAWRLAENLEIPAFFIYKNAKTQKLETKMSSFFKAYASQKR